VTRVFVDSKSLESNVIRRSLWGRGVAMRMIAIDP